MVVDATIAMAGNHFTPRDTPEVPTTINVTEVKIVNVDALQPPYESRCGQGRHGCYRL